MVIGSANINNNMINFIHIMQILIDCTNEELKQHLTFAFYIESATSIKKLFYLIITIIFDFLAR